MGLKISRMCFNTGPYNSSLNLELEPGSVTIFVGPNNSGKSLALNEIERWLNGEPDSMKVFSDFDMIFPEEFSEFSKWIENLGAMNEIRGGFFRFSRPSFSEDPPLRGKANLQQLESLYNSFSSNNTAHLEIRKAVFKWATVRIDGRSRLDIIKPRPLGDLTKTPEHHLTDFVKDREKRQQLRKMCNKVFPGQHLTMDHTSPQVRIRMSKREPYPEEETTIEQAALKYQVSATPIENLGDGVGAYTGIGSILTGYDWRYLLIDDPEAFLHPPVVRKLGSEIATQAREKDAQVFASTHSAEFVKGCLEISSDTTIVRLTYDSACETASASALDKKSTYDLVNTALLRSIPVLQGLFHYGVVVTESDTDRVFYDEINRRLTETNRGVYDCLFINAQNRDTVQLVIRPLRQLGIPAVSIVDIDHLYDGDSKWLELLDASQVSNKEKISIENQRIELVRQINTELQNIDAKKRRSLIKANGCMLFKGKTMKLAENLLMTLRSNGIFVVPLGELESWLKHLNIKGHGTEWLKNCFSLIGATADAEGYTIAGKGDVWDFVEELGHWISQRSQDKEVGVAEKMGRVRRKMLNAKERIVIFDPWHGNIAAMLPISSRLQKEGLICTVLLDEPISKRKFRYRVDRLDQISKCGAEIRIAKDLQSDQGLIVSDNDGWIVNLTSNGLWLTRISNPDFYLKQFDYQRIWNDTSTILWEKLPDAIQTRLG